ncbi:MAG TPA: PAS domain S-box protein [Kofleriaceae bacterium]|nr:PAS domain S-box protein [Kofleriaceae bacterium]
MSADDAPGRPATTAPDAAALGLRAVLRAAPDLYLLMTPDFRIVEVSDAYLRVTMTAREQILGRELLDVFPDDPNEPEAKGAQTLREAMERTLAEKRPQELPVQRYPIRRPAAEGGQFEERYWSPRFTPVLADDGQVAYILHRAEDVTEVVRLKREKLEQAHTLHEVSVRSQHYRRLLDTAPDAIVIVGEDGRIQLVNLQTETLFGYTRAELVGQPLDLLIPERFCKGHTDHMSRYFASPSARPMGSGLQLHGRRKDGTELPIEVSLSPQRDEHGMTVSAAIRDVTERKRLEAAARLTDDRLRSAVDAIQDGFALFDGEDRLVLCNSVFRRLVGEGRPGSLVGKRYAEILDARMADIDLPDAAARARFRDERLAHRRHDQTSTFTVRLQGGRSLRVSDRRTAEGGIVETVWDATDDERRTQELREARATAEAASAAKSDFLSSMSHELRTPLNAILGFAQLLTRDKREPLSDRHRERVEHILRGGEHLLRLINDILDLSRIEAGRVPISLEPVGVAEVLDEVRRTLEPIAARQGISLEIAALPPGLPMVVTDRTRFAQILMNLGSNAIKYNRADGSVRFEVTTAPDRVRVTVIDSGIGIPLEQQGKLFQPFQRAGQETGPIEGTGIGLVITKRLAELMHGSVGFHSVPTQGSEFWVEMPMHAAPAEEQAPVVTPREHDAITPRTGEHHLVLYVEDNPANVVFMRDLMSSFEGIDLITVPTAELGVELARARQPELVLMDINLPGMSGLDALHALRAAPETAHIPVIALTAAASERDRQRGLEAGFYRYLTKPVKVDELIDAVESLLARRA